MVLANTSNGLSVFFCIQQEVHTRWHELTNPVCIHLSNYSEFLCFYPFHFVRTESPNTFIQTGHFYQHESIFLFRYCNCVLMLMFICSLRRHRKTMNHSNCRNITFLALFYNLSLKPKNCE